MSQTSNHQYPAIKQLMLQELSEDYEDLKTKNETNANRHPATNRTLCK